MKRRAAFSALSAAGGLGESHRERRKQSKEIAWPKVKQNSLYQKEVKGRKGPREALARYCDDAIYTYLLLFPPDQIFSAEPEREARAVAPVAPLLFSLWRMSLQVSVVTLVVNNLLPETRETIVNGRPTVPHHPWASGLFLYSPINHKP